MNKKTIRKRYSAEFKEEALKLASTVGFSQASADLGIYPSQLYNWRAAQSKKASTSKRENTLAAENARLRRELAIKSEEVSILKKAAAYFATNQK